MFAIIYIRVSTEDQVKHGYSLEAQEKVCIEKAFQLGCTEYIIFRDEGISGDILNRPGLTEARKLIRQGGVDYFICLDPDRLARSLTLQLVLTDEIEKANVNIEFINFEWKNTPDGKLFAQMRGAIAEYEKAKIRERTNSVKIEKAKSGLLTHFPGTYGYKYDRLLKKMLVDEEEARVVQMIYNWFLEPGKYTGPQEIANRLNDLQIKPPRGEIWHRVTVRRILRNPTYTGTLYLRTINAEGVKNNRYKPPEERISRKPRPREEWCKTSVPEIIPQHVWEEAQQRFEEIRRKKPGKTVAQYLLSGLLRCGFCNCTLHGNLVSNGKRNRRTYRYYVCTAKSPGIPGVDKCNSRNVPADKLEETIWNKVKQWLLNPELLAEDLKSRDDENKLKDAQQEQAGIKKQIEEVVNERVRILRLYQKGNIPEDLADSILKEINDRELRLKKRMNEIEEEILKHKISNQEIANIKTALKEYARNIDNLDFEGRQYIIRLLIKKVIVYDNSLAIKVQIPPVKKPEKAANMRAAVGFDSGNNAPCGGPEKPGCRR